jgi:sugar phosphate isomerase/epimerase
VRFTRRYFGALLVAGPFVARSSAYPAVGGVHIGLQSASFTYSGMGIDDIIKTMRELGLAEIDVMAEHVENYLGAPGVQLPGTGRLGPWVARAAGRDPQPGRGRGASGFGRGGDPAVREALRKWRLEVDLDRFREVGRKFSDAGLRFFSYNLSFNDSYSDEEIERAMLMTKALGTRVMTASSPAAIFPRLAPFLEKHDVIIGIHNHTTGPEEFEQAMKASPNVWVNLDVGHFFASGHDPVAYLKEHHARITNIHIKDRMKSNGPEMPFGQGETPLREVLRLVWREKWEFPVCIEYVGPDGPPAELKRCLDYCKEALA